MLVVGERTDDPTLGGQTDAGRSGIPALTFDGGGCDQRCENDHGDGGQGRDAAGGRHVWPDRGRPSATVGRKRRGAARHTTVPAVLTRPGYIDGGTRVDSRTTSTTTRRANRPRTCPETNCRQGRPRRRSRRRHRRRRVLRLRRDRCRHSHVTAGHRRSVNTDIIITGRRPGKRIQTRIFFLLENGEHTGWTHN